MQLSQQTLDKLDPRIAVPRYDRSALRPGILHIGLGNFHRAHQALYLDDLMVRGDTLEWGILGAGAMPGDAVMRKDLAAQNWLYSVVEQDAASQSARVVGAMTGFVEVEAGHGPLRAAMRDPETRVLSLTVTEGGYYLDAAGHPNLDHPALLADIEHPDAPTTVFGAIVAGLRDRRAAGVPPFTIMSCDNLPHNGAVARTLIQGLAERQDAALGAWVAEEIRFPNSMVDRITPATTPSRAASVEQEFGLRDKRPVFCEPFRQWVLEDSFTNGRPPLEQVGVEFVTDVTPFEMMKIRILNGGHAIIAYAAGLLGIEFAHEAMENPLVAGFLEKIETTEVIPMVPPVPGTSTADYFTTVKHRFGNPRVEDTIQRLCFDGSNRQPKFVVPTLLDNLRQGGPVEGLALESALWCRYCMGHDENGKAIEPNDPSWDRLQARAKAAVDQPSIWLEMDEVYGETAENPRFRESFEAALHDVLKRGTAAVLNSYL